jgi:hypothetical protein
MRTIIAGVGLIACVVVLLGCGGKPNQANIELRKKNQDFQQQIDELKRQRQADAATIRALEQQRQTVPTLPHERLEQLYTTHGLRFGRLTGGIDTDPERAGDEQLKVYVVPTDQSGDLLKAAGSFVIEAFDLSLGEDNRLGRWEYSRDEAAKNWYGDLMSYGYAFAQPWQRPPRSDEVTVRVTFEDALTGRVFTEQALARVVAAPSSTGPATLPSTSAPAARVEPSALNSE